MCQIDNANKKTNSMPRKLGSVNRVTSESKQMLSHVLEGQMDRIGEALDEAFDRNKITYLQLMTKLLPFIIPKSSGSEPDQVMKRPLSWLNEN